VFHVSLRFEFHVMVVFLLYLVEYFEYLVSDANHRTVVRGNGPLLTTRRCAVVVVKWSVPPVTY
jgi:hypothetical protein